MPFLSDKILEQKTFLLVAHYATFAYQDLLFEYLTKRKAKLVTKVNFPLPELPLLKHIEITQVSGSENATKRNVHSLSTPPLPAYLVQSIQFLWLILSNSHAYDYVIAEDSLLACCSIILRKLGKIQNVIFYSHGIDFTRFNNRIANRLYQQLDHFSATHSNYNWFLSLNMIPIRQKQGISKPSMFWIPSSLPVSMVPRKTTVSNHKLVFLGVLNDKNGVGILPDIIYEIRKTIPDVTLDIMGEGDMKDALRLHISELHLEKNIRLLGNLEFGEFKNLLTYYRVGIVTYKYSTVNLIPTSDSMKMRVYLATGLPVVLTKGFIFSDEVDKNKLGFTVNYDAKQYAKIITRILTDKKLSDTLRKNALAYSKKMDLTEIYNKTFQAILKNTSGMK